MKQRILLAIVAGLLTSAVMAQDHASSVKTIHGPSFKKLSVTGPVSVELIESSEAAVKVEGGYDFINAISTNWTRDELYIIFTGHAHPKNPSIKVYVNGLNNVYADNGARVTTPNPLVRTQTLKVSVRDEESLARILSYGKINVGEYGDVKLRKVDRK